MHEDQRSISDWATQTFGNPTPLVAVRRMLKEAKELEELIEKTLDRGMSVETILEKIADETADIFITGYKVFDVIGYQAHACVDHKMHVNRYERKWVPAGDGTGQHVKE